MRGRILVKFDSAEHHDEDCKNYVKSSRGVIDL